jgi:hypothetical protein
MADGAGVAATCWTQQQQQQQQEKRQNATCVSALDLGERQNQVMEFRSM